MSSGYLEQMFDATGGAEISTIHSHDDRENAWGATVIAGSAQRHRTGNDPTDGTALYRRFAVDHVIRDATIDDADAIGAVVVRAWQAAYRGIMPDDYLDGLRADERAAMWQRLLADPGPDRWVRVLTVGHELVGFAACGPELADVSDGETGQLYAINLDPGHWTRGLGRALLTEVTQELAAAGYRSAVLWVATANERARRLYESEGWTTDGRPRDAEILGVTVNEVRYRKRLDT